MNRFNRTAILPTLLTTMMGVALLSTPAHAQDASGGGSGSGSTSSASSTNDHPNYSWLGLLGLAGLAGFLKKPAVVHEVRRDSTTGTAGTR